MRLKWIGVVLLSACAADDDGVGGGGGALAGASECVHTTSDYVMRGDSDTLPTGSCDPNEPECLLVVREPCPCVNVQVPRSFFSCTCDAGTWNCTITSQDAGVCSASQPGCVFEDGGVTPDGG